MSFETNFLPYLPTLHDGTPVEYEDDFKSAVTTLVMKIRISGNISGIRVTENGKDNVIKNYVESILPSRVKRELNTHVFFAKNQGNSSIEKLRVKGSVDSKDELCIEVEH